MILNAIELNEPVPELNQPHFLTVSRPLNFMYLADKVTYPQQIVANPCVQACHGWHVPHPCDTSNGKYYEEAWCRHFLDVVSLYE